MKFVIIGTCQVNSMAAAFSYLRPDDEVRVVNCSLLQENDTPAKVSALIDGSDIVITQWRERTVSFGATTLEIPPDKPHIAIPVIVFCGFHPDCTYIAKTKGGWLGPIEAYSSVLITYGFLKGLSPSRTIDLFRREVYTALEWDFGQTLSDLHGHFRAWGFDIAEACNDWLRHGVFMHTINHPKLRLVSDVLAMALRMAGLSVNGGNAADYLNDPLHHMVWPIMPGWDLPPAVGAGPPCLKTVVWKNGRSQVEVRSLEQQVHDSYRMLSGITRDDVELQNPAFMLSDIDNRLTPLLETAGSGTSRRQGNPYRGLPDFHYWRQSVADLQPAAINPMVDAPFRVNRQARIATAGSCFAQHIANRLQKSGYNYYVAEPAPPDMEPDIAHARSYGQFSARYGNIYTARQLLQLFRRAHGTWRPLDEVWPSRHGGFVDPFRPHIEGDAVLTATEVVAARDRHLEAVRDLFKSLDVFVFTLGLTEAWRNRTDGAVFPLPPGSVSDMDWGTGYEFVNFGHDEIIDDLTAFIAALRAVNPEARIILTVSPVPLIATWERRHVLTSTVASKSILRAAADQISRSFSNVMYFPSYEIITMAANRGAYFDVDMRSVLPSGVDHVMAAFFASCAADTESSSAHALAAQAEQHRQAIEVIAQVICDEEKIIV